MGLYANYPGNVEHIVGEVKGPDRAQGYAEAVEAVYDPATDRTRVRFRPLPLHEAVERLAAQFRAGVSP